MSSSSIKVIIEAALPQPKKPYLKDQIEVAGSEVRISAQVHKLIKGYNTCFARMVNNLGGVPPARLDKEYRTLLQATLVPRGLTRESYALLVQSGTIHTAQKIIDRDRPAVMAVLQVLHLGMLFTPGINSEGKVVFNGSSGCPSWEKVAVSMLDEEGHSLGEEIQQNMEYVNKLYAWKVKSDSDAGWLSPEVYTSYRAEAGPPKKKRKVEFGAISVWIPCRSARRVPAERKQSTMTWSSSATWRRT
mgnify:CR=1 FL=1